MGMDILICLLSIFIAFYLRNLALTPKGISSYVWQVSLLIIVKIVIFRQRGMYRPILRYTGIEFVTNAAQSVLLSLVVLVFLTYLQGSWALPRFVLLIDGFLTLVLIIWARILIRSLVTHLLHGFKGVIQENLVIIYGAGVAGSQLAQSLASESSYRLLAFVDDNPELQRHSIQGIPVYSPAKLEQLWHKRNFGTVILAISNLGGVKRRKIVENLQKMPVVVKTIPTLNQLLAGEISIEQIRNVDVADLLGREEVLPYPELLSQNVTEKAVLVTGAGGSIGSELCRQIAQLRPTCLVMYELNEFALYQIDLELAESSPGVACHAYLGNVTNSADFEQVVRHHRIETIYHAAAYKHVPLVESNPAQGIYNNVQGTAVVAQGAIACGVKNFVLISTDKAVRPTNIMGASKRIAELIVQSCADHPQSTTCFAIVRFGNVLGSSGSVVPRFRQQIAEGKAITLTHPDVTRYFMSIPEAVRLVMQAGAMAEGGEVFLLDMGEPIKIYDLAVQMIRLSGLIPGEDIEIKLTGLRPGEKLYEELLIDGSNIQPTRHPKIYCSNERKLNSSELGVLLEKLIWAASHHDLALLYTMVKTLVPEYQSPEQENA